MQSFSRRDFFVASSLAVAAVSPSRAAFQAQRLLPLVVETLNGRLRGIQSDGVAVFRGVRYAADTGGRNRFMAPQPVANWAGIRDATNYGQRAPQGQQATDRDAAGNIPRYGEDCCVLNVFTPAASSAAALPVLVFIHGGGFRSGSGDVPTLAGERLARHGDNVVVTLNRRLNVLGFANLGLVDPEFSNAGIAGQLDLVAALHWVRTNISAFGGDPSRVTVFGVSGGGSSIEVLGIMPSAQGLYHRTINMSGSSAFAMRPAATMVPVVETFLKTLDVGKSELRKLQMLPPAQLRMAYESAMKRHNAGDYRPVVDGHHVPYGPLTPQALAIGGSIPGIMSCTADEASAFMVGDRRNLTVTLDQVRERVAKQFAITDQSAAAVLSSYREASPERTPWDLLVAIASDALVRKPQRIATEIKTAARLALVYAAEFNWKSPRDGGVWGATHGIDVPFAFGTFEMSPLSEHAGIAGLAVSRAEMSAFSAFATSGNPNNTNMPRWEAYSVSKRPTMVIDQRCQLLNDYRAADRRAADLLPNQDAFDLTGGPLLRFAD